MGFFKIILFKKIRESQRGEKKKKKGEIMELLSSLFV
jgi:hypothetical protein